MPNTRTPLSNKQEQEDAIAAPEHVEQREAPEASEATDAPEHAEHKEAAEQ